MPTTIDQLQIEVETKSEKAQQGLSKLKSTLQSLNKIAQSSGLDVTCKKLEKISSLDFSNLSALSKISQATKSLQDMGDKMQGITESFSKMPSDIGMSVDAGGISDTVTDLQNVRQAISDVPNEVSVSVQMKGTSEAVQEAENVAASINRVVSADDFIQAKSEADILKMKLDGVKAKLTEALNTPNSDSGAIANLTAQAKRLQAELDKAGGSTKKLASDFKTLGSTAINSVKKALKGISQLLKIVLVYGGAFRALQMATQGVSEGLNNISKYSKETAESMSKLSTMSLYMKNSIGAALYPVIVAITPALQSMTNAIVRALNAFNQFVAAWSGNTEFIKAKEYLQEYGDTAKSTANKIKKSFAGMDEITVIGQQDSGADKNIPDYSEMFEKSSVSEKVSSVVENLKKNLDNLKIILGGALLVIGAILTFSGASIPLGIGLMIAGVAVLASAVSENWNSLDSTLDSKLGDLLKILAIGAMAIGAILAFSGANIPLGIALMLGGALALATAVTLSWDGIPQNIKNAITTIGILVGAGLLAIGAVLAFSGVALPLGIGLMVVGAITLATAVKLGWDALPSKIKDMISKILAVVSVAFLVLGIIICVTGVGLPLGIALIVLGAAGLATAVAINWDWVKDKVKTVLSALFSIVSVATLVLGIILCLSGAGLPIGLALIKLGAEGIERGAKWDDNAVTTNIKNSLDKIKKTISGWWDNLKKWWSGLSLSQINFKMPHFTWSSKPAEGWIAKTLSALSLPTSLPTFNVSWYANGGFPDSEDGLFFANHNELVGKFSNGKTAVANNDQIVTGIQNGVYAANQEQNALLREQNSLLRKLLEKDSTVQAIVSTSDIEQGLSRKNRRNGLTKVPVG